DVALQEGDHRVRLRAEVTQTVLRVAIGPLAEAGNRGFLRGLLDRLPAGTRKLLNDFLPDDFFTPRAEHADRLADLALGGFTSFEGGTAGAENSRRARERFVMHVRDSLDDSFRDAFRILGGASDDARHRLDELRQQIDRRLTDFVGVDQRA